MPPRVLRPVETRDPAMVHVIAVREPDEDAKLSGTATRRMIIIRRLLPGLSTRFATKKSKQGHDGR